MRWATHSRQCAGVRRGGCLTLRARVTPSAHVVRTESTLHFSGSPTIVIHHLLGGPVLRVTSMLAVVALLGVRSLAAQENETTVTLTVSPTFVNFSGFGGSFGAAVARLSVGRGFTRHTGGELSAFALAPLGGASSQPDCPALVSCQARSTPSVLSGLSTSVFGYAGETGLRASAGLGVVGASGGEGLGNRSSLAGIFGLDYVPRSDNRFVPTFAFRVVQLASPIAGARQLLLPGVGLSF